MSTAALTRPTAVSSNSARNFVTSASSTLSERTLRLMSFARLARFSADGCTFPLASASPAVTTFSAPRAAHR